MAGSAQGPKKPNPETGAYPGYSAYSCNSLQPQISRKSAEFSRHLKGHFSIGNVQVRILRGQPTSPGSGETDSDSDRKARQWRAFANWSLVSRLRISTRSGRKPPNSQAVHPNLPLFGA